MLHRDLRVSHLARGLLAKAEKKMKRLLLGFLWIGSLGSVACGGRVIEQPGDDDDSSAPAPTPTSASGSAGAPAKPGTGTPFPTQDLGLCEQGFDRARNPSRPCHWLTKSGQCFDDKDRACACICPQDGESLCVSGFDDGPNSATLVRCN